MEDTQQNYREEALPGTPSFDESDGLIRRAHHAASSCTKSADVGMETKRSATVGRGPHR